MLVQDAVKSGKKFYYRGSKPKEYYLFHKRGTGPFPDHPNCYFSVHSLKKLTGLVDWWYILNGKRATTRRWSISKQKDN